MEPLSPGEVGTCVSLLGPEAGDGVQPRVGEDRFLALWASSRRERTGSAITVIQEGQRRMPCRGRRTAEELMDRGPFQLGLMEAFKEGAPSATGMDRT